jgi:hypothetical protein
MIFYDAAEAVVSFLSERGRHLWTKHDPVPMEVVCQQAFFSAYGHRCIQSLTLAGSKLSKPVQS